MVKSNTMQVHLNQNNTINGIFQDIGNGAGIYVDVGSFNWEDGSPDVAVLTGSTVNIFRNTNINGLDANPLNTFSLSGSKIKIAQMNEHIHFPQNLNDKEDIIIVNGTNLKIYLNNNNNGINTSPYCDINVGFTINDLDIGDLNGDGYNDILLSGGSYPDYTAKYYSNVQGVFINGTPTWSVTGYPNIDNGPLVTIGDVDRNGQNDIVVTSYLGKTVLFLNNYGFGTTPDQNFYALTPESVPHQIKIADIYNTGGQALVVSFSNPAFQNEHYGIRCVNALNFDMNPVPPVIEGTNYFDGSQWRPRLVLQNKNERDFLRYDIYKYSPNTGGQVVYVASTASGDFIDYSEYLLPPGDGPNWNCYYYAKMVDQTSHVSLPSNYAYYWVGGQGGCDGCEGDNFSSSNNSGTPNSFNITNYPNPFNPATTIYYSIPRNLLVKITVYNMLGQLVKSLVNENKQPGQYSAPFDGSSLSSGMYYYTIEAGEYFETRKMVLVK
jgi:hypothetical protein